MQNRQAKRKNRIISVKQVEATTNNMPKKLHEKLEREYKGLPKEEREHAVYGTMNKIEKAKAKSNAVKKMKK